MEFCSSDGPPLVFSTEMIGPDLVSLRDWFAGESMNATLYGTASWGACEFMRDIDIGKLAEFSYMVADAMLKEREKINEQI